MFIRRALGISVSSLALVAATPMVAQQFYVGAMGEFGTVSDNFPDTGTYKSVALLGGVEFAGPGPFKFALEGETSLSPNLSMDILSKDYIDRLSRFRALAGYDFNGFNVFGAVGLTTVSGVLVSTSGTFTGYNVGAGVSRAVTSNIDLRGEIIHDRVDVGGFYKWENTSLRAGAVVHF